MRTPLPAIAREARGLRLGEARHLVACARKDAALADLAALCRDRRVAVRSDAAYALIAFLVLDVPRERLIEWSTWRWNTPRADGSRGYGSRDVEADLAEYYQAARTRFLELLTAAGVPDPAAEWRRRRHAYEVGVHQRAERYRSNLPPA